jgi:hypothetical protein
MNLDLRGVTRGKWALRAVVVLGPLVAVLARTSPLGAPPVWLVVLVLALAAAWALAPESIVGVVTLLVVGLSWATGQDSAMPASAVMAALGMLAAHLAALVSSYGPARLPVDAGVVRLWLVRGAGVFVAAPVVWLLARVVRELPDSGTVWVLGLSVAVSVVLVAAAATQALMLQDREE